MKWRKLKPMFALLLVLGCTGTEVGNPEMEVLAKFGLEQQDTCGVEMFKFRVHGVHFFRNSEKLDLWMSEDGYSIDMAAEDQDGALPKASMPMDGWDSVRIDVKPENGNGQTIENTSWNNFKNGKFIKGWAMHESRKIRFLFEIPEMKMDFICRKEMLSSWHQENRMEMEIMFNTGIWIRSFTLAGAETTIDSEGESIVVLGYDSNPQVYEQMLDRMKQSFNADSVFMQMM